MMRISKSILAFVLIIITMNYCSLQKRTSDDRPLYKTFESYLLNVVNDTSTVYIPLLEIVDKKIYSILDSVIYTIEHCKTYDKRIKYLYGAAIRPKLKENDSLIYYKLYHHWSINDVLESKNIYGGFYYKNYFFLVDNCFHIQDTKISFCLKNGCQLRVHPTKAYRLESYYDYMEFTKKNGEYVITINELCGHKIIID